MMSLYIAQVTVIGCSCWSCWSVVCPGLGDRVKGPSGGSISIPLEPDIAEWKEDEEGEEVTGGRVVKGLQRVAE